MLPNPLGWQEVTERRHYHRLGTYSEYGLLNGRIFLMPTQARWRYRCRVSHFGRRAATFRN